MSKRYVVWACMLSCLLGVLVGKCLERWEGSVFSSTSKSASAAPLPFIRSQPIKSEHELMEKAVHDGNNWSVAVIPVDKQWGKEVDIYHGPGQIAGWRYVPLPSDAKPKNPATKTETKLEKLEKESKSEDKKPILPQL